jgi:hypothetical protein
MNEPMADKSAIVIAIPTIAPSILPGRFVKLPLSHLMIIISHLLS